MTDKSKRGQWFIAWKIFLRREVWLPIAGFAVSFAWILSAMGSCLQLYGLMAEPAPISARGQLSDENRQVAAAMEGVACMTVLQETQAPMTWGEYRGTVSVYGVDEDFLQWLASENLSSETELSEAMAYGVLSQSAAAALKKVDDAGSNDSGTGNGNDGGGTESGNASRNGGDILTGPLLSAEDLMTDFYIGESGTVRLYGLIEDMDGSVFMEGFYLSESWYQRLFALPETDENAFGGENNNAEAASTLLVIADRGHELSGLIKALEELGLAAESPVMDEMDKIAEEGLGRLYLAILIFICSLVVLIYQEALWRERHRDFMADLNRFYGNSRAAGRILGKSRLLILGAGLAGSVLWQWLTVVLEI